MQIEDIPSCGSCNELHHMPSLYASGLPGSRLFWMVCRNATADTIDDGKAIQALEHCTYAGSGRSDLTISQALVSSKIQVETFICPGLGLGLPCDLMALVLTNLRSWTS